MKSSVPSNRLVSAFAVATVSIAALAAAASSWLDERDGASPSMVQAIERPAADAPVSVVKAPAGTEARQQPASCRDCAVPTSERRL
jgi:hypothetical protein